MKMRNRGWVAEGNRIEDQRVELFYGSFQRGFSRRQYVGSHNSQRVRRLIFLNTVRPENTPGEFPAL